MTYISIIANAIGTKVARGRIRAAESEVALRPIPKKIGRKRLAPGAITAGCQKGRHQQCYSLNCGCSCHLGGNPTPIKMKRRPMDAATRESISRSMKRLWANKKGQHEQPDSR